MPQIPHAEPGKTCPLWKKDISKVCHTCAWYIQVRGKDPQSDREIDHWGCSMSFLPLLLIEGAQQTRQAGAAIESFRNETVDVGERMLAAAQQRGRTALIGEG